MENEKKSSAGYVFLGIMIAVLVMVATVFAYFIVNDHKNADAKFGTDVYHSVNYSQAVKTSGKTYLNVKWPFFTDSSWKFQPLEFNGKQYVLGTCKVTAKDNPEKVDVYCIFQLEGKKVLTSFFATKDKVYYDGIGYTGYFIASLLGNGITYNGSEYEMTVASTTGN